MTGVAAGSATITATWSAIADKYNAGSQEFNVTVVAATVYNKVTSVTQLVAGNEYIVVAPKSNMAMGAQSSSIRTNVSVTIANDQVAITNEEVAVLTLGGSYGAWTFLASDNNKYLALTSSSNALHASDDAKANGAKWTITEDFQLANVEYNTRVLKYNSGSPRFACYTSGQQTAVLFVKAGSAEVTTVPVTITDAEYATFVAPYPLDFSETGITAYTAKANTSSVALTEVTQVPAGATVVLYKAGADGTAINVPVIATADALENNDLVAGPVTGDGASYYALGKEGAKVGFGILANGTELPANKAYIAASKFGAGAPAFMPFDFGGTTDISEKVIVKSEKFATAPVYNLAGQRVMNPSKGLFIMNGKKVAIK